MTDQPAFYPIPATVQAELAALREAKRLLLSVHTPAVLSPDYGRTTWDRYLPLTPSTARLGLIVCAHCDSQNTSVTVLPEHRWPCPTAAAFLPTPRCTKDVTHP